MAYSYPDDIPEEIQDLLVGAQKIWISTYNFIIDDGGSEDSAKQAGWVQVNSEYEKNEDGNWAKKKLIDGDDKMSKREEYFNDTEKDGFFKSFIPFSQENGKVKVFTKQIDGQAVKFLRGVASNTSIDKEDERMSKEFIAKMKSTSLGMNVFAEHEHTIEKTLGYIEEVGGDDDSMILDVALEDENKNPLVKRILEKIDHGINIGYSIGGRVTKAISHFSEEANKTIRELVDGDIYEASLTAMPAGNGTWVAPITKSLNNWLDKVEPKHEANIRKILESEEKYTPKKSNKKTEEKIDKSSSKDETTSSANLSKILEEVIQRDEVHEQLYDLFWAFRSALSTIVYNEDMDGATKKEKIIALGTEFGDKIEVISETIANLEAQIQDELGNN